jgi:hypothetical protein
MTKITSEHLARSAAIYIESIQNRGVLIELG